MVWFQCEDCGDNLKKPKLPNHFRFCSASRLSCIDCGQVFGQQNIEGHTQCITEAEKYGPKGQGKAPNGMNAKPKNDSKQKLEVDINVGLSERPPWFCSLCNTNATSKQTLLLHADGKKHRAKARAFHSSKQKPNEPAENKDLMDNTAKSEAPNSNDSVKPNDKNSSKIDPPQDGSGMENGEPKSNKKRKLEASENGDGEVIQNKGRETEVTKGLKKAKHSATKEDEKVDAAPGNELGKKKIKWKRLIASALKSNLDGKLKLKKLRKLVVKSLQESGSAEDKNQVSELLEQKINSSSKFILDGKYVRFATSSS